MKNVLTILTLLLAITALAPCGTFAAEAPASVTSAAPNPAAPDFAAITPLNQKELGQDFMTWLEKQPNQQRQERTSQCDVCHTRGGVCCFDTDHTFICLYGSCD